MKASVVAVAIYDAANGKLSFEEARHCALAALKAWPAERQVTETPVVVNNRPASSMTADLVDTETARLLLGNIGKTKLFALFNEGKIARKKLGTKTLVPVASINEYLNNLSDTCDEARSRCVQNANSKRS